VQTFHPETMKFNLASGYCDLNLAASGDSKKDTALLRRAFHLGYTTVALNIEVDQKDLATGKKAKKAAEKCKQSLREDFPEPPEIPKLDPSDYPALNSKGQSPVILRRLTLTFSSNDFLPVFNNSATVKSYDLVALVPTSALALQNLLKSGFRADIIAFSAAVAAAAAEPAPNVKWNRKLYNECVEKHMVFELTYAQAISDSVARRKIIRQSHVYHSVGKSRSVVVSSGGGTAVELRSPHDVINLAHLFNLNEQQAKNSVTKLACDAVKSGSGRRLGPYRCVAQVKSKLGPQETWKVPSDPMAPDPNSSDSSDSDDGEGQSDNGAAAAEMDDDQPMKIYD